MKKFNKICVGLLLSIFVMSGCDGLLDVESERYSYPEDNIIKTTNDAIYGMNGLFSKLSKLADRYVLLGELRGDLMDVNENTRKELRDISDFTFTADNKLIDSKDYYAVINNCNYIIQTIDTTVIEHAEKILYREFAATKAIRAWTYLQLALNYGSVKYYDEAFLTVKQTEDENNFNVLTLNELIDVLIEDLVTWQDIELPESISYNGDVSNSAKLFFPIRFVLGDLYLWKGEFEQAAQCYYDLIFDNEYYISESYKSRWEVENNAFITQYVNFYTMFDFNEYEHITLIAGSKEHGETTLLDSLFMSNDYEIQPSKPAIENWEKQTYYHNSNARGLGDLRGHYGSYYDYSKADYTSLSYTENDKIIIKFNQLSSDETRVIPIYRIGLLYLRYAEAVNRSGKPNLAFATIKNGLNSTTLLDTIVPPAEKFSSVDENGRGPYFSYTNFESDAFEYNLGVHERGCGNTRDFDEFVIPQFNSIDESIEYVEDLIVEELALETAFEGGRFHDLMRIADRRSDPNYLAEKVSAKHTNNKDAIRAKLQDRNNWFLPTE